MVNHGQCNQAAFALNQHKLSRSPSAPKYFSFQISSLFFFILIITVNFSNNNEHKTKDIVNSQHCESRLSPAPDLCFTVAFTPHFFLGIPSSYDSQLLPESVVIASAQPIVPERDERAGRPFDLCPFREKVEIGEKKTHDEGPPFPKVSDLR